MHRSRLLLGIAAVFAGITVAMSVLGVVYNLFLVVFAVPFGLTAAILWYHATGRLENRVRERERYYEAGGGPGGPDGRSARSRARRGARERVRGDRRAGRGPGRGWQRARRGQRASVGASGPSATEAYDILDLDPGADADAVRDAYREKVKSVHPDSDEGSEEAFKQVNRAYERLRSR